MNVWRACPSNRITAMGMLKQYPGDGIKISAGFWGEVQVYYGFLKRWTGAVWLQTHLKVYSGTWTTKLLKRWDGSWKEVSI
jgi:hypothetical protein